MPRSVGPGTESDQIAALRAVIRARWRIYRWLWGLAIGWVLYDALVLLPLWWTYRHETWPPRLWAVFGWSFGIMLILGLIAGLFLGSAGRDIGARLHRMSRTQRAEALAPFAQSACRVSAMSEMLSPFLRDVSRTAELTPASTPDAQGNEPTAAERRMSDEQQIAALQEEIHRAGRVSRRTRRLVFLAFGAFALLALVVSGDTIREAGAQLKRVEPQLGELWHRPGLHAAWVDAYVRGIGAAVLAFSQMVFAAIVALAAVALLRWRRMARLTGDLVSLPPTDRAAALLPLHAARDRDARKIAASLARRLRLPAEVAPAPTPDARGDEPSPAERMP